mmetsp:Transcript_14033/g.21041  ORF Transcript_14033/g.21041 Transcript_14033/m.21041 type:complete len:93 (-) Transcript_14033:915-1193(-)
MVLTSTVKVNFFLTLILIPAVYLVLVQFVLVLVVRVHFLVWRNNHDLCQALPDWIWVGDMVVMKLLDQHPAHLMDVLVEPITAVQAEYVLTR